MNPLDAEIVPAEGPLRLFQWTPPRGQPSDEGDLFGVLATLDADLERLDATCLQWRLYLEPELAAQEKDRLLGPFPAAGDRVLTGPGSVLCNRPCGDGLRLAGVQVLAWEGGGRGRISDHRGARVLDLGRSRAVFVSGVTGELESLDPELIETHTRDPLASPFEHLFAAVRRRLAEQSVTLKDVARTWLYADPLIEQYDDLNRSRDRLFALEGLRRDDPSVPLPASTGIQGASPDGDPCFADLIAVRDLSGDRPFAPIQPKLQPQAWEYGSAFSRGMSIRVGRSTLHTISGTASIGPDGATVHVDEPAAQIHETLRNVESLLAECSLPPRAPGHWTMYFKDQRTWEAYRAEVDGGRLAPIDGVAIFADVCRDDLLFEVEVTVAA